MLPKYLQVIMKRGGGGASYLVWTGGFVLNTLVLSLKGEAVGCDPLAADSCQSGIVTRRHDPRGWESLLR